MRPRAFVVGPASTNFAGPVAVVAGGVVRRVRWSVMVGGAVGAAVVAELARAVVTAARRDDGAERGKRAGFQERAPRDHRRTAGQSWICCAR